MKIDERRLLLEKRSIKNCEIMMSPINYRDLLQK